MLNKKSVLLSAVIMILVASIATIPLAYADSAGPRSGTTFTNVSLGSGANWGSTGNAAASDNSLATVTITSSGTPSDYLRATGFGFTIPASATVLGIEVGIERSEGNTQDATISDNIVSLVKNNVIAGNDKGTSTAWPTTDTVATYGAANDLWGTTWTAADINNANFGVVLSAVRTSGGNEQARVDHMTITVSYAVLSEQGPTGPTTQAGNIAASGGNVNWSNAAGILTTDNSRATATLGNGQTTNYLQGTGFNLNVPTGSTIYGIQLNIERSENGPDSDEIRDSVVRLVKNNVVVGTNKAATTTDWPQSASESTAIYGGNTDLWGTTWTAEDVNNANFGFVLSAAVTGNGGEQARVDAASIIVYYTPPLNTTPAATPQSVNTNEDTSLPITLTGNANDAGQTLTFEIVTNPAHGTLTAFNSATGAVTYNPTANYNGADSFTFRVNDGFENSASATVLITVNSVNDAPTASNTSTATNEDTPVTLTLTGADIDSGSLTFSVVSGPTHGSLGTITSTGSFTAQVQYTPASDYNGPDSFTFRANDGSANSNTATASITVNAVNDNPVANEDTASTDEDTPVDIDVLANDSDIDGITLSVTSASDPANGSTIVNVDNTVTYTPDTDYNGADSFTYSLSDGNGGTATATANVTVDAVNDAPVATDDSASTDEDNSVNIDVVANDTDVEGSALEVVSVTAPADGTAVVELDGTVTYTPATNFAGSDAFDYVVSDGDLTDTGTVTITVDPVNDNPVAADDNTSTDEDTPVTVDVVANDTDVEGNSLTVTLAGISSDGDVVNNGDGTVTYTPNTNFNGNDSFTYTIGDGNGGTASANVSVAVGAVNDAPVASDDSATTDEDTPVAITLTATDMENDSLDYLVVDGPSSGTLSGTAPDLTYTPNTDFNGDDSFTFKANDGDLDSNAATISITVGSVNDAPVLAEIGFQTVDEMTELSFVASATDVDASDAMAYGLVGEPEGASIDSATGAFTWTPTEAQGPNSYTFEVTVSDGNGGTDSESVTVTVNEVNMAPSLTNPGTQTTSESAPFSLQMEVTDSDLPANILTYGATGLPSWATIDVDTGAITGAPTETDDGTSTVEVTVSDGSLTDSQTFDIVVTEANTAPVANSATATVDEDASTSITLEAADSDLPANTLTYTVVTNPSSGTLSGTAPDLTYTPNADFNGSDSFTFQVNDGSADSNIATVSITVGAVNDIPSADNQSITTDEDTQATLTLTGSDIEDATSVSYTVTSNPANGVLSGTAPDLTYTPNTNFNGSDEFKFMVTDSESTDSAEATVTITVSAVNDNPVAEDDTATTDEDTPVTINVLENDTDVDLDTLSMSALGPASDGTAVDNGDGTVTYTPAAGFNGNDSFGYTVSDGNGGTSTATVSIAIATVNDNPVAEADASSTDEDTPVTVDVLANDSDDDGDSLSITSIETAPLNGAADINGDNTITYTPNTNFNGNDSFSYEVSDGNGGMATATVTIEVAAVNDAPVAVNDNASTDEETAVTVDVLANDSDIDADSLIVETVSTPSNGNAVNNGDGTITYTPNTNFVGQDAFEYTMSDGVLTATATVTVDVGAVNDIPSADNQSITTDEDTQATLTLTGSDIEDATSVSYTVTSNPANGVLSGTAPDLTYTPNTNFNGSDEFKFMVTDSESADSAEATVTITVSAVNDAPTADNQSITTDEDTQATLTLTGSDIEDGSSVTYTVTSGPSNGVLSGTAPDLTYTPNTNFNGSDEFKFMVTDSESTDSAEATVTITISSVNGAPVLAPIDPQTVDELSALTFTATATDTDGPTDTLTYSLAGAPTGASINADTGAFTWTPTEGQGPDAYTFDVVVTDTNSDSDSQAVTVTVNEVNSPPVLAAIGPKTVTAQSTLTFTASATDTDVPANTLVYSLSGQPSGASINASTGAFSWTPTAAQAPGNYNIDVIVSDGSATDAETVSVTVNSVPVSDNIRPLISITSPANGATVNGASVSVAGTSSDSGSGVQLVEVRTETSGYSTVTPVSPGDWSSWTHNLTFATPGSHQIVARATDNAGNQQWFVINVTATLTDTTRPTVSITSPTNGATMTGTTAAGATVHVTGTAADSLSGVQNIEVKYTVPGGFRTYQLATPASPGNWSTWSYDITFPTAGAKTIVAKAMDNAGNLQWFTITVNVQLS